MPTKKKTASKFDQARATEARIARRVSRLRQIRRLTLEALADEAELSKGYLSKIENGRQVPPIGTLARIAGALGTDVSYFLQDQAAHETERVSVVRASERQPVVRGGSDFGYDYLSLAHHRRFKQMEPFIFKFPQSPKKQICFEHAGEEFLFVLTGKIAFEIGNPNNKRSWVLDQGDCIYFDSDLPHHGHSLSEDATALVVVLNPAATPA